MTLKKFYYLLLAIGLLSGLGAGIYTLSVFGVAGASFKHRLIDLAIYPGFAFIGAYSSLLVTMWLAKNSIGLNLPRLGEMKISAIGDGAQRYFSITYLAIGSVMALLVGYVAGVIWALIYGNFFILPANS
jgi:hypothetical protein